MHELDSLSNVIWLNLLAFFKAYYCMHACNSAVFQSALFFFVFVVTLALASSPCSPAHKQTWGQGFVNLYHDGVLIID